MVNQTKVNVNRIDELKQYIDTEVRDIVADITFDKDTIERLVGTALEETLRNYVTINGVETLTNKTIANGPNLIDGLGSVAYTNSYNDLYDKPTLERVATTGSYNDLKNKPTIPAAQIQCDWNATSGMASIAHKPTLATVATSGKYSDLTGTPTIGDATLTIKRNGTAVNSFKANATANVIADISVPTKVSELTNDSNFISNSNLTTVYCVLEHKTSGNTSDDVWGWYRTWSDGWIEQGGQIKVTSDGWNQTFNLIKQFSNTNYFITGTCANNIGSKFTATQTNIGAYVAMMTLTQKTFKAWTGDDATFNSAYVRWYACGF